MRHFRPSRRVWPLLLHWLLAAALLLPCCGGTASRAKSATERSDDSSEYSEAEQGPSQCDDGTCFLCGENVICPQGYFCDESAAAGPACEWLPECPEQVSCSCVLGVLGDTCSCDERDGGVYVSC